ncbi:MAG: hypothetical protein JW731_08160 [Bacteroidales bacterium]|nr:hypothetical protein [Bacteroidales bacterium]
MNRQQFIDYVKSPEKMNAESVHLLEGLVKEYPYCQTADILFTLILYKEKNIRFNQQLKVASAYASDRKLLKKLIHSLGDDRITNIARDFKTETKNTPPADISEERNGLQDLIRILKNEIEVISERQQPYKNNPDQEVKLLHLATQLERLISEKPAAQGKIKGSEPTVYKPVDAERLPTVEKTFDKSKQELIDKFIKEEPKITSVAKAEFFNPVDFAKQSLIDDDAIVSETLAEIHYKQGNLLKAINIYKKLSLINPGKSSYFAAQIEKIQKEIK